MGINISGELRETRDKLMEGDVQETDKRIFGSLTAAVHDRFELFYETDNPFNEHRRDFKEAEVDWVCQEADAQLAYLKSQGKELSPEAVRRLEGQRARIKRVVLDGPVSLGGRMGHMVTMANISRIQDVPPSAEEIAMAEYLRADPERAVAWRNFDYGTVTSLLRSEKTEKGAQFLIGADPKLIEYLKEALAREESPEAFKPILPYRRGLREVPIVPEDPKSFGAAFADLMGELHTKEFNEKGPYTIGGIDCKLRSANKLHEKMADFCARFPDVDPYQAAEFFKGDMNGARKTLEAISENTSNSPEGNLWAIKQGYLRSISRQNCWAEGVLASGILDVQPDYYAEVNTAILVYNTGETDLPLKPHQFVADALKHPFCWSEYEMAIIAAHTEALLGGRERALEMLDYVAQHKSDVRRAREAHRILKESPESPPQPEGVVRVYEF